MNIMYIRNMLKFAFYMSFWMCRSFKGFMYINVIMYKKILPIYSYLTVSSFFFWFPRKNSNVIQQMFLG